MKIFKNKKTIKTFVILVITFVCLLGIKHLANQAIDVSKEPYLSEMKILMKEDLKAGLSMEQALGKAMKENPDMLHQMTKEASRKGKIIAMISIVSVILLLYFASVAITYFTHEEKT